MTEEKRSKNVLITGASFGIGKEMARVFAREGYSLLLVARSTEKLEELAGELRAAYGTESQIWSKDLSRDDAAAELYMSVKESGKEVHILVNNAGMGMHGNFCDTDRQKERDMIRLNILALTDLTKLFLPDMVRRGSGIILNVGSTASFQPGPLMAVYYATKAYVLSFSEAVAEEVRGTGVQVSTLCPGPTDSEFQKRSGIGKVPVFTYASMSAERVAEIAYKGIMKGKRLILPGFLNKLSAFSPRIAPRFLVLKIVRSLQSERTKK